MSRNVITSPFHKGQLVAIPAGTLVRSMNPRHKSKRVTKRDQVITVHHTFDGAVDLWNDHKRGRGLVLLPSVSWPGSGGYWQDVQVTAALLEANNLAPLTLPDLDEYERGMLDVEPSFDGGYTDEWKPE